MMADLLIASNKVPKRRRAVVLLPGVLLGLVLARVMMVSMPTAIFVLAGGIILAITLLLRRIDLLIYLWFALTSSTTLIVWHLLAQYQPFMGSVLFWGLLCCVIAAWAMDNVLSGRQFVHFDNVPIKVVILFALLWGAISVVAAANRDMAIRGFSHIVIGLAASYMFYDFFSRNQRNIQKTVGVLLFMTLAISLAVLVTAAHAIMSGVPVYKKLGLWLAGSNAVGGLFCYSTPILLTAGLSLVSRKGFRVLLGAVMLVALFFSFARTSWVGTLAAIAFLLWRSGMKRPMWFAIVTGLIIAAWWFPVGGEDFLEYIAGDRYTGRQIIWKAAWNMACDHPFFGVGPGNALLFMGKYLPKGFVDTLGVVDTHSLYLRNAAEMGFPFVVMWLAVFALVVYNSIKIEDNMDSGFLRLVCRGATATFVAISVRGMGENGSFLTAFSAGEFFVMVPYMALAMPFAAKKLAERAEI